MISSLILRLLVRPKTQLWPWRKAVISWLVPGACLLGPMGAQLEIFFASDYLWVESHFLCSSLCVNLIILFLCDYIQSDKSLVSPKHYFRDLFRVHISSEEQPICNILLPLSCFGLPNISECHLVILLNFYGVPFTPTPILGCTLKKCYSWTQSAYFEFK